MKTIKLSLISTIFVAAFGLALGLMSAPAQAHCKGKHLVGDECVHDAEGERSQTFDVELIADGTLGAIITGENCIGRSQRKQVTDGKFPPPFH